jgi:hypothetical protein
VPSRKFPEVPDEPFTFLVHSEIVIIKVKVKFTLKPTTKAQRGVDVYFYSSFKLGTR